jgi:hypothetical protein
MDYQVIVVGFRNTEQSTKYKPDIMPWNQKGLNTSKIK